MAGKITVRYRDSKGRFVKTPRKGFNSEAIPERWQGNHRILIGATPVRSQRATFTSLLKGSKELPTRHQTAITPALTQGKNTWRNTAKRLAKQIQKEQAKGWQLTAIPGGKKRNKKSEEYRTFRKQLTGSIYTPPEKRKKRQPGQMLGDQIEREMWRLAREIMKVEKIESGPFLDKFPHFTFVMTRELPENKNKVVKARKRVKK